MNDIPHILGLPYTQLRWIEPVRPFLFQNKVEINFERGFYGGCYQVTQGLYEKIMGENPSYFKGKHRPVESVSWDDAQIFLEQLNRQVPFKDGLQFRLPSEAMWEYAARAEQNFEYSGSQKLQEVGWFDKNSNQQTMPVGLKEPNAFGLYDMSGNVWEWCEDNWNEDTRKTPSNGTALEESDKDTRVIRGGSWDFNVVNARVLFRDRVPRNLKYDSNGFRVFRY